MLLVTSTTSIDPGTELDQRVHLHGVRWADYEHLLAMRGESSVPRITYLQGELELMGPSQRHEIVASMIARLLEAYAEERGIELGSTRCMTWKDPNLEHGAEADASYFLGPAPKPRPDLVIEVVLTSGGLDKLEIYRGFEVPEAWLWRNGRITVHVLAADRYVPAARSALFPDLDVDLVARLAERRPQTRTVRLFRRLLRRR